MLIEFVGLPGAGKTSLIEATRSQLGLRGLSARAEPIGLFDRREALRALLFALVRPRLSVRLIRSLRTRRSVVLAGSLLRRERIAVRLSKGRGCTLVDEGPLHAIAMFAMAGAHDAIAVVNAVTMPAVAVMVVIEPRLAAARTRLRYERGETNRLTSVWTHEELERFEKHVNEMLPYLRCPILRTDGSVDVDVQASDLAERLIALPELTESVDR